MIRFRLSKRWFYLLPLLSPSAVFATVFCTSGTCDYSNQLITSANNNEPALQVSNTGHATGSPVNIFTTGSNSPAINVLDGGSVTFNSGQAPFHVTSSILSTGFASPIIRLSNGSNVTISNYLLNSSGGGASYGVDIANEGSSSSNTINLNNANMISASDAFHVFNSGPLFGAFINVSGSNITPNNNIILNATSDGSGVFVLFGASESILNGDIFGTSFLESVFAVLGNTTFWTGSTGPGQIFNIELGANSVWTMTASSRILNAFINAGDVNFTAPSNGGFKTLQTGTLFGISGSSINMFTQLGGNDSPTDMIVITGATALRNGVVEPKAMLNPEDAEGDTALTFTNFGGAGDVTTGDGILVVDAVNGATTSPTAFHLAAPAVAGPYEYSLVRGSVVDPVGGANDWFLRSEGQYSPLIPLRFLPYPFFRSEVSLYSTLPSLAVLYTRGIIGTLHQRMSQQNFSMNPDCGSAEFPAGGWFRVINGGGDIDNGTIFESGADFKYHYLALQTGFDLYHQVYPWGGRDYGGVTFLMGDATSTVEHYTNVSAGNDSITSYSFGAYYTYYGENGWYVDALAMGQKFDMYADSKRIGQASTMGNSLSGSIEAGLPFRINDTIALEPQAQMIYQTLGVNNLSDVGATVRFGRTQSFLSRVGLLVGKTWCSNTGIFQALTQQISGWARLNYWHEAYGKSTTNFSSATGWIPFTSNLAGNFVQADFGFSMPVNRGLSFYADAGEAVYLQNKGRFYTFDAGFRMNFV